MPNISTTMCCTIVTRGVNCNAHQQGNGLIHSAASTQWDTRHNLKPVAAGGAGVGKRAPWTTALGEQRRKENGVHAIKASVSKGKLRSHGIETKSKYAKAKITFNNKWDPANYFF